MSKNIVVVKGFKFADRGIDVIEYTAGKDVVEVSDDCAEIALAEGWAKEAKDGKPGKKVSNQPADIIDHDFENKVAAKNEATAETLPE